MKLRVLIVDDHKMFREALQYRLARDPEIEVVAEAGNGVEALAKAAQTHPDIVCMDIHMRGLNGIETTRQLLANHPGAKVIGLSAYSEKAYVLEMLEAGAIGYVTKGEAGDELLRAIRAGVLGRAYLSPDVAAAVADIAPPADALYSPARLDAIEQQIFELMADNCSSREIAERLAMEAYLVEAYRRSILHKLGLRSEADISKYIEE